jgi:hypothetical protein
VRVIVVSPQPALSLALSTQLPDCDALAVTRADEVLELAHTGSVVLLDVGPAETDEWLSGLVARGLDTGMVVVGQPTGRVSRPNIHYLPRPFSLEDLFIAFEQVTNPADELLDNDDVLLVTGSQATGTGSASSALDGGPSPDAPGEAAEASTTHPGETTAGKSTWGRASQRLRGLLSRPLEVTERDPDPEPERTEQAAPDLQSETARAAEAAPVGSTHVVAAPEAAFAEPGAEMEAEPEAEGPALDQTLPAEVAAPESLEPELGPEPEPPGSIEAPKTEAQGPEPQSKFQVSELEGAPAADVEAPEPLKSEAEPEPEPEEPLEAPKTEDEESEPDPEVPDHTSASAGPRLETEVHDSSSAAESPAVGAPEPPASATDEPRVNEDATAADAPPPMDVSPPTTARGGWFRRRHGAREAHEANVGDVPGRTEGYLNAASLPARIRQGLVAAELLEELLDDLAVLADVARCGKALLEEIGSRMTVGASAVALRRKGSDLQIVATAATSEGVNDGHLTTDHPFVRAVEARGGALLLAPTDEVRGMLAGVPLSHWPVLVAATIPGEGQPDGVVLVGQPAPADPTDVDRLYSIVRDAADMLRLAAVLRRLPHPNDEHLNFLHTWMRREAP